MKVRENENPKEAPGRAKVQLQLCPPVAKYSMAMALMDGAAKYGAWNWHENSVNVMTYVGAMQRHLDAFQSGEDIAPDSGVSHLAHVLACAAIILDAASVGNLNDDRPRRET